MRPISLYQCGVCDFISNDRDKVFAHEAEHFGISSEEYTQYLALKLAEKKAGIANSYTHNAETDKAYDDAIKAVLDFEKKHGIGGE